MRQGWAACPQTHQTKCMHPQRALTGAMALVVKEGGGVKAASPSGEAVEPRAGSAAPGRRPEPSPAHVVPEDHPPAWHSLKPRAREPSWSPEPPPSPVRGPHGVLPPRLRASQETLETTKDWPPPPPGVELDQLEAPPPPRAFMPGTWSPRPEHLPLTAATAVSGSRGDPRSPGALAAAAVAGGGPVIYDDHHLVRHAADCPAHRLVTKQECDRSSSRPASRPSSRPASRQGSRTTSRPATFFMFVASSDSWRWMTFPLVQRVCRQSRERRGGCPAKCHPMVGRDALGWSLTLPKGKEGRTTYVKVTALVPPHGAATATLVWMSWRATVAGQRDGGGGAALPLLTSAAEVW
ncbi:hypothetical protein C7M84_015990 [Penaeus vannamei]|uniref:Uncharacterized protein n=1 Tax=Penaeus vannamei TaxID=6689 RepID=A0A3R7LW14_PENVA|nr:hypothetical protein C7M84_015990 [Penaeus vannamei]